jgi:hypothetical protein
MGHFPSIDVGLVFPAKRGPGNCEKAAVVFFAEGYLVTYHTNYLPFQQRSSCADKKPSFTHHPLGKKQEKSDG